MQVTLIQPDIAWQDAIDTCAHVQSLLAQTAIAPGGLIVLPEMFATGFSMNVTAIAESDRHAPGRDLLRRLAMRHHAYALGGVVTAANTASGSKGLNQALLVGPDGSELLRYTKIHPFGYSDEPAHYQPGHEVHTCDVAAGDGVTWRVAPLVCYDLRFPELFRIAAGRGAQLLAVIACWPASRIDHWLALLRARAIENQAYVVGVNRTGDDPYTSYDGQSIVLDPKGRIVAQAGSQPGVTQATLDLQPLLDYRAKFPALSDMKYPWHQPI